MYKIIAGLVFTALSCLTGPAAQAGPMPYSYTFTASGFSSGAPTDPVSGSFTVTIDPLLASNQSGTVDAITLVIDGHSYTVAETGFQYSSSSDSLVIGGLLNSVGLVIQGPDFLLALTVGSNTFNGMTYASQNIQFGLFSPTQGSVARVTSVPEPATLALVALGLAGLRFSRRRKQ